MMSVCKVCLHWRSDAVRLTSSASAQRILHHANFPFNLLQAEKGVEEDCVVQIKNTHSAHRQIRTLNGDVPDNKAEAHKLF